MRTLKVDLNVRLFIFDPHNLSRERANLDSVAKDSWVKLLGPRESPAPGGDVLAKADTMAVRARELRNEIAKIDPVPSTAAVRQDTAGPVSPGTGEIRAGYQSELRRLEKNRETLLILAKELKAMASDDLFLVPHFVQKVDNARIAMFTETMSRLALVSHLMGETPVLSKSGGEGVKHLDTAAKFLATVADNGEGLLPPLDPDVAWLQCHKGFSEQVAPQAESLVNRQALAVQHILSFPTS